MRNLLTGLFGGLLALLAGSVSATDWHQDFWKTTVLENPLPENLDRFGAGASIADGVALIGVPSSDVTALNSGRAYLLDVATGALLHILENPSPNQDDRFGEVLSMADGVAIVGASWDDTTGPDSGRAYMFDVATGNLLHVLENPAPNPEQRFGNSVSIADGVVIVGAYLDYAKGVNAGRAYLFDVATGALLHTLENPAVGFTNGIIPLASYDQFGRSVVLADGIALVGAPGADNSSGRYGRVYFYDAATGNPLRVLENPGPSGSFGVYISAANGVLAVGSPASSARGYISLFDMSAGNLLRTLRSPVPNQADNFGTELSIGDGVLIAGAPFDDTTGLNSGRAYVFEVATGDLLRTLENPSPNENDWFGVPVAVADGMVYAGAIWDSTTSLYSGRGYLFRPTAPINVDIDIQPLDPNNGVKPASNDLIMIAVLGTSVAGGDAVDFDATQVDPATLKFGRGDAPNSATPWVSDWDGDAVADDIAFGFKTQDTGIFCGDTEATLVGETYSDEPFVGTDTIVTTDCEDTGCHP